MNGIIVFLFGCYCAVAAVYLSWATRSIVKLINELNRRKHRDSEAVWRCYNPPAPGWYYVIIPRLTTLQRPEPKVQVALWDGHTWPAASGVLAWMWPRTAMELLKANQPIHVRLEEPRE